ncbi:Hsp70 family protein [Glycomyces paridis]|uniref:Pyrrolo-quinoline quinone repeat domain-containing protein n=1 Tax=Glycomyces paridis TaxID=2126555 RepID=A0A4S8NXR4_9ACTN|nr:Hsp70 family protein [Glycomyces paridis]THV21711.1 hypothetical protein E9998_24420 [Glycomyces paridis]
MQTPVRLAVDLGTTHTVAVVGRAGQEPRSLLFDGSPLLASGVFLDADGTLHTGRDAQRLAAAEPERFEPHPKRRIDDGRVLLGDREVPVEELLATGLRRVAEEAAASGLRPAEAVITHPADWGPLRRNVLERAAAIAGLDEVRLVPEPIAAATYCASVLGQEIPRGGTVAIFDFGGGTFDVAVVRRDDDEAARLRTLAFGGLDDLGGLDVDMALTAHLGRIVAERDPELWQRLSHPETTADLRDRLAFWSEVRAAKEMLSRTSTAPVALPGHNPMGLHLTRDELTSLADPLVARAVDETRRTLERVGVAPASLAALLLVGGSSRMPLVATRLHARLGVVPSVPEQPELPVAYGAYQHAVAEPDAAPVTSPPQTPPAPAAQSPVTYAPFPIPDLRAAAPVQLPPVSTTPAAVPGAAPSEPQPAASPAPSPPAPGFAPEPTPPVQDPNRPPGFATPDAEPRTPAGPYQALPPQVHTGPLPVGGPPPRNWVAVSVFSSIVMVVVVALVVALSQTDWGSLLDFGGDTPVEGAGTGTDGTDTGGLAEENTSEQAALTLVAERELNASGASAVTVGDGAAYLAQVAEGATTVWAVGADGAELWTGTYDLEPTELHLVVVGDVLVIDAYESATDEGESMRAAVDTADGDFLWKRAWDQYYRNDVAFYGTDVLVEQRDGFDANAAIRIDLRTGDEVWYEAGPEDLYIIDDYRIKAETVWDTGEDEPGTAPPNSYSLYDNLAATDRFVDLDPDAGTAVVRDAGDGGSLDSGDLPFDAELWTAFDGRAIGKLSDEESPGRAVLAAYALDGLGKDWTLEFEAGFSIKHVKPCGPDLVCAALDHLNADDQYKTIAVDTETGEQVWQLVTDWAFDDHWYGAESGIAFGDQVFDTLDTASILYFDGTVRSGGALFTNIVAVRGDLVVTESYGTENEFAVIDVATGGGAAPQSIGSAYMEHASVAGDLVAVLTDGGLAQVFTVPDLG